MKTRESGMKMKPEGYRESLTEVEGWPLRITSYHLGGVYHSQADNVSPGAWLARTTGATRDEAEQKVLEKARHLLARTRRRSA
jgi:hypothetical protein